MNRVHIYKANLFQSLQLKKEVLTKLSSLITHGNAMATTNCCIIYKMGLTSKTGLTASPTKKVYRYFKAATVHFCAVARPAPFVLRPFAGLYNPYPYGCSLLCNHPTDTEAKELVKKVKDSWAIEGKNVLLAEEIAAIRAGLQQQMKTTKDSSSLLVAPLNNVTSVVESVPEELFRRYTETDSRPLTPAPTLASGATRASGSRRCVTPDPLTNQIREKTLLILDLRRSHSQETLSYHGSSSLVEPPPLIRIHHISGSCEDIRSDETQSVKNACSLAAPSTNRPKSGTKDLDGDIKKQTNDPSDEDEDEDEFIKRRGKRRRRKGRDASRGPPAFQASLDPETQVAAFGSDSHDPSARPSLTPGSAAHDVQTVADRHTRPPTIRPSFSLDIDSYLDTEILKQLRRELNEEIVDNELDSKRRAALQEALKTVTKDRKGCDELVALQKQLKLPEINAALWLSLPRIFTRASARFELPMDSRSLSSMTPLDYAREHVTIIRARKLLYNCVFNKFKMEVDSDLEFHQRNISGNTMQDALDVMMGKAMSEDQSKRVRHLIGWRDDDVFDFKTFCGICAICERLLASEYSPQIPDRKTDPCHEIETADFEVLARKINGQNVDPRLLVILNAIKTL